MSATQRKPQQSAEVFQEWFGGQMYKAHRRVCEFCEEEFIAKVYSKQRFCSNACANRSRNTR